MTSGAVPKYFRLEPEVPGELGDDSVLDTSTHPPIVSRLQFVFTGWDGDDLVTSFPSFLVTERLGHALVAADLTGASLAEAEVTVDEQFGDFFPEVASALPRWLWLKPVGVPWASDVWVDQRADLHVSATAMGVLRGFSMANCEITEL